MQRFRLTVEYDGAPFVGWQRQENGLSVQEALETAIFNFAQETTNVAGAGRTDAGVHARAMTAHMDLAKPTTARVVREALNHFLKPHPIAVLAASAVDDAFHARFSATARHYEYLIANRRAPLTLERGRAWRMPTPLDAEAMDQAAQDLVGRHDFTTFRAAQCQAASPVKTLHMISADRDADMVRITVAAPSFLHNQVRSIVGSLVQVGAGRWPIHGIADALAAKSRAACGQVAPADGLYFLRADYPQDEVNTRDRSGSQDDTDEPTAANSE